MSKVHKVCIIGSGPAGYTSAIYCARALLNPVLVTGHAIGGQLMTTTDVENFPGYPHGVTGPEMMKQLHTQAARFGTTFINTDVKGVDCSSNPFRISLDNGNELLAQSVIVATGAEALWLNLPGEKELRNKGCISCCAVCDGFFHKDEDIIVVGGGDSMCEEATFLTKFAKKVTVIHRRDEFRASKIMLEHAKQNPKIEWKTGYVIEKWLTNEKGDLNGVLLKNVKDEITEELQCEACFLAIGHKPSTSFLDGRVEIDDKGYILHKEHTMTSVPGIFACGDCVDTRYKQAISAAGTGCQAALDCENWLQEMGNI
jgi:thioredoxin reductase (NADPH)